MGFPATTNNRAREIEVNAPELDDQGRQVHHMESRKQATIGTTSTVDELWRGALLDKEAWLKMYTAIISAALLAPGEALDLRQCADLADAAYLEFHIKQNPPKGRR